MTDQQAASTTLSNPLAGFTASPSPASIEQSSPTKSTIVSHAKAWAWRLSAAYIWITFLALLLGQYDRVKSISSAGIASLINAVSRVGLSPTDPSYFVFILKLTWLLAITRFSLIEVAGFFFYVLGFPFGIILKLLVRKFAKGVSSESSDARSSVKTASQGRRVP